MPGPDRVARSRPKCRTLLGGILMACAHPEEGDGGMVGVAKILGITRQGLWGLCHGHSDPSVALLERIARYLGRSVDEVLAWHRASDFNGVEH